jgi:hypothetical protein
MSIFSKIINWQKTSKSRAITFPVGAYRLDAAITPITGMGLVEFSPKEYLEMGRQFVGEKNYKAPQTNFLGRLWDVKLQIVNGRICKIVPYIVVHDRDDANKIAMQIFQFCTEQLGKPAEQKTGQFIWDTTDGNVILLTSENNEGMSGAGAALIFSIAARFISRFALHTGAATLSSIRTPPACHVSTTSAGLAPLGKKRMPAVTKMELHHLVGHSSTA